MRIGFIGLGRMGGNMVRRLLRDGHEIVAYNRSPEKTREIAMRIAKLATGRFEIAGLDQSFHGLTAGAASVTWSVGRGGYGPQLPGTFMIPAPYAYRCPVEWRNRGP